MYLNKSDLSVISKLLISEIGSCNLALTKGKSYGTKEELEEIEREFNSFKNLYCKINNISLEILEKHYYYINLFSDNGYKYVRSYGFNKYSFEEIESFSYCSVITKQGSEIGWGVTDRSCFIDDVFYPYGIDRKDVFLEFKRG
ncbi:MAG: hypothetical protein ACRC92_05485 [Peptostreptococcaceae bacterium]